MLQIPQSCSIFRFVFGRCCVTFRSVLKWQHVRNVFAKYATSSVTCVTHHEKCNTSCNRQHVLMRNMQQILLQRRRLFVGLPMPLPKPPTESLTLPSIETIFVRPPRRPPRSCCRPPDVGSTRMVVGDRSWSTSSPPRKNSSNHAYSRRSTCSSSEVIHPRTPRMPRSHTSPGVQSIPGATTIRPPLGTTAGSS
jgi:hypothetical protein